MINASQTFGFGYFFATAFTDAVGYIIPRSDVSAPESALNIKWDYAQLQAAVRCRRIINSMLNAHLGAVSGAFKVCECLC